MKHAAARDVHTLQRKKICYYYRCVTTMRRIRIGKYVPCNFIAKRIAILQG